MATMKIERQKAHQRIGGRRRCCLKQECEILHLGDCFTRAASDWFSRTAFRNSGNFPSNIACLISRMMSRYRCRLWRVARVEKVISPARNRWRR